MTRLIDADALIEDLKYDVELDTRALDDADLLLGMNRELVQFDKDCKENAIHLLKDAPTVDAIPVNWLSNLAKEYEESDNQFFRMDSCVIEDLIKRWKEQEKNND